MIKAVLFDLDGTLVHYDYDAFIKAYLGAVSRKVAHVIDPQKFIQRLLASTEAMINSLDATKTNMDVFWEHFADGLAVPLEVMAPILDEFYIEDFPKIRDELGVRPLPEARKLLERLVSDGYEVIVATNPVFPAMAIEERMRWGDIDGIPYQLVTTYETSRFCKPSLEYYREILDVIGRSPNECIMVGNNTCEDLVAKDLGIMTYLVEDCLLDMGPFRREPDRRGSFTELVKFFENREFRTTA